MCDHHGYPIGHVATRREPPMKAPIIWVYSICWNEMPMIRYWLRHYSTFADKIIVYDENSTDGTREEIQACPIAELRDWPAEGLDDEEFIRVVNNQPQHEATNKADWVMWPDVDELLWHSDVRTLLTTVETDIVRAKGYALISPTGWPKDDGRQLYEQVRTGVYQENENKAICWRPSKKIVHHHGKHDLPEFEGRMDESFQLKLFHCHHVGGIASTAVRNMRNILRAKDKKYAWAYTAEQEEKRAGGTAAWVQDVIENGKLFDVIEDPL